ncbi:acid phosphatase 1 [Vigna unguiculata]|uniref:acid phosphatase 1 n=1 Tax=Vigna unguiculata TaxID=3917 RepID=UPI001016D313|nr:acid phosphatase 1 [Vigna unguiculata]
MAIPIKFSVLLRFLFLFSLFLFSVSDSDSPSAHQHRVFPRPLIVEHAGVAEVEEEVRLRCGAWRVAGEANNLGEWKTVPKECAEFVKEYMTGKGYLVDLEMVSKEAEEYAKSVKLSDDGKDAWIFDIDETLLSNLPYYSAHGYGLEVFDHDKFDDWVETGGAPAIEPSLKLYEGVLSLGFKVILLTGRSERHRSVTIDNLVNAGFKEWDQLILRRSEDQGKRAVVYKSEKRSEMEKDGYRILGNSGDQWSDLLGSSLSVRSFKLPNPMYYIP